MSKRYHQSLESLSSSKWEWLLGLAVGWGASSFAWKMYARESQVKRFYLNRDSLIMFREEKVEHLDPKHDDIGNLPSYCKCPSEKNPNWYWELSRHHILWCLSKFDLTIRDLQLISSTLIGFVGHSIIPLETIDLYVTFDVDNCLKTMKIKFLFFDIPSVYNTIVGHPTLNQLRAIVSIYYMTQKSPTNS